MNRVNWTDKHIEIATRELGRGPTLAEVARRLSERWGIPIYPSSIARLFERRKLPAASSFLPQNSLEVKDSIAPPSRDTIPAPAPSKSAPSVPVPPTEVKILHDGATPSKGKEKAVADLLAHLKKGDAKSLEEFCDALGKSPKEVRLLVSEAQGQGFDVEIENEIVGRRPTLNLSQERTVTIPSAVSGWHTIAGVGDIHVGSKHFLRSQFLDFVHKCYEEGVRMFACVGDMIDGVYRHSVWEQSERGLEAQADALVDVIPNLPGAVWPWIKGNHDETFEAESGMDVGRVLDDRFAARGRKDVMCVGSRGAYIRLRAPEEKRGTIVELWHPKKGPGYALTYAMQNHIRDYAVNAKPDILLTGHWHQSAYFTVRGVHAMSCGAWQGGKSSYGRSLGGSPAIGSWKIRYGLTEQGTIRRFAPEWFGYYEGESPREFSMG